VPPDGTGRRILHLPGLRPANSGRSGRCRVGSFSALALKACAALTVRDNAEHKAGIGASKRRGREHQRTYDRGGAVEKVYDVSDRMIVIQCALGPREMMGSVVNGSGDDVFALFNKHRAFMKPSITNRLRPRSQAGFVYRDLTYVRAG
jgi:hypothetical protein